MQLKKDMYGFCQNVKGKKPIGQASGFLMNFNDQQDKEGEAREQSMSASEIK
jgi:hypothetical protein